MTGLPYFENPPVVESVLGFQFDPLPGLNNAHLAMFWQTLGEDAWPQINDTQLIQTVFERFGEEHKWVDRVRKLKLSSETSARLQMMNASSDRMVQLQNGRLHYNWRKQGPFDPYPRYAAVRSEFDAVHRAFEEFVRQRDLGALRMNQWEVTYVNHIDQGELWQSPSDWHRVLPSLLGSGPKGLKFEGLGGSWHFELEPRLGRLHISLQLGKRTEEPEGEVIRLDLTARGPMEEEEGLDLDRGLNLGHEMIVETFVAITSEEAHRHWSRK